MVITYADGSQVETDTDGSPIPLDPDKQIVDIEVNTGSRVLGPPHGIVTV
jgi:hypothetical protein